jgi:hypothetical protein
MERNEDCWNWKKEELVFSEVKMAAVLDEAGVSVAQRRNIDANKPTMDRGQKQKNKKQQNRIKKKRKRRRETQSNRPQPVAKYKQLLCVF